MDCGSLNRFGGATTIWDYKDDPYGRNSNGATILMDPNEGQAHEWNTPTVTINSGGAWYNTGPATCPVSVLGGSGTCYIVRLGHLSTIATAPMIFVAMAPPFAGVNANGTPNQVDSHPGFCSQTQPWCFDSRPMDGGPNLMVGSSGSPFVNVTGQLWKFAGAQSVLHRKSLNTVAYAGNYPLVDISGPSSSIASDSSGSYEYCYALAAGECYSGSSAGDIYVNAPYVSYPYCNYPGIARMPIDTNSICVGDLSAYAGNLVQVGVAAQDIFGALSRRLGPNYAKWNMMDVYWTLNGSSNGLLGFSQVLWLDGVRTENLITVIPPYPAPDSISRGTFIPISVTTAPPPSLMVNDAIVEFGYAENGDPGGFFCTSRQESCVAVSGAVDASTPFFYEQVEAHSGARCSAGCTVAIPALPQRVLYYRWKYRDAFGKVIATSEVRATATP
jgi:hypothetical protein